MYFRCCRNPSTQGHAVDCPLKPPASYTEPPPVVLAEGEGCQFDIVHFQHIGECKGTCDGEEGIQFADDESGVVIVVLIAADDENVEERLKKLEESGALRRLSNEEMEKIISGETEVTVLTMTLSEMEEKLAAAIADPFLTIKQCAEVLGFSEGWTRELCRRGRLEGAIKLMRRWAIPQSALLLPD